MIPKDEVVRFKLDTEFSGKKVLTLREFAIPGLVSPFSAEVRLRARIALIGPNGIGKSHFVKALVGDPSVSWKGTKELGAKVRVGYFNQLHLRADFIGKTPIEVFQAEGLTMQKAMPILSRYGLGARKDVKFEHLSGGQQARLQLSVIEQSGADLLILDEPTDNLDVISATEFEYAITNFQGTVICVTHDRWLLRRCFHRFWHILPTGLVEDIATLPALYQ